MDFQVGDCVAFERTNGEISNGKISEIDPEEENPYHILFVDKDGRERGDEIYFIKHFSVFTKVINLNFINSTIISKFNHNKFC
jgi:hypothetical protein